MLKVNLQRLNLTVKHLLCNVILMLTDFPSWLIKFLLYSALKSQYRWIRTYLHIDKASCLFLLGVYIQYWLVYATADTVSIAPLGSGLWYLLICSKHVQLRVLNIQRNWVTTRCYQSRAMVLFQYGELIMKFLHRRLTRYDIGSHTILEVWLSHLRNKGIERNLAGGIWLTEIVGSMV